MKAANPMVFFSSLSLREARIKLQARVTQQTPVHFFSARKIKFPEVVVQLSPDGRFCLRQRKTYFNPWAPQFYGSLQEETDGTCRIEGGLHDYATLQKWTGLYRAALTGGILTSLTSLYALIVHPMPSSAVIGLGSSLGWLIGLMTYLVIFKRATEKRYRALAIGEDVVIRTFLQQVLQAKLAAPVVESGIPADECVAN